MTALDVRRRFGQIIDEAAAGERIVIERAGQPVAAIVPLSDLARFDPETIKSERLKALGDLARRARREKVDPAFDAAKAIRGQRLDRSKRIVRVARRDRA